MKKITWIPLLIIIVGICLALAGFATGGMKGLWLDRGGFHTATTDRGNLVKVDETFAGFSDIDLNVDFLDRITFKEGEEFAVRGQNYERNGGLKVNQDGGTLRVEAKREGRWLNIGLQDFRSGFRENETWVEITYPKGSEFGNVTANVSAGRVYVETLDCVELYVDDSFGRVDISSLTSSRLTVNAASGDVRLTGVEVNGTAVIDNDFGNIDLSDANADSMTVNLNSGHAKVRNVNANALHISNDFGKLDIDGVTVKDLTMSLSSGDLTAGYVNTNDLTVRSSFGTIRIDRLVLTGRGDIEQNSGDVNVSLDMSEDDLSYELNTNAGSVTIDGRKSSGSIINRSPGTGASLRIDSDFGAITIKFLN